MSKLSFDMLSLRCLWNIGERRRRWLHTQAAAHQRAELESKPLLATLMTEVPLHSPTTDPGGLPAEKGRLRVTADKRGETHSSTSTRQRGLGAATAGGQM